VVIIALGFAFWNMFQNPNQGTTDLLINEVEWIVDGEYKAMSIPIQNVGGMPVTIESISVRKSGSGSTEYTDNDPIGIASGTDTIASGGADTFYWNSDSGSAPFDFLQSGETYVIKVTCGTGAFFEKTVTAPTEMW
jgi:hypothetical protein